MQQVIPMRGEWIEYETDSKKVMYVKVAAQESAGDSAAARFGNQYG